MLQYLMYWLWEEFISWNDLQSSLKVINIADKSIFAYYVVLISQPLSGTSSNSRSGGRQPEKLSCRRVWRMAQPSDWWQPTAEPGDWEGQRQSWTAPDTAARRHEELCTSAQRSCSLSAPTDWSQALTEATYGNLYTTSCLRTLKSINHCSTVWSPCISMAFLL